MDLKLQRIDALAAELKALRPLNETEKRRLMEEFVVNNTYDSNAIEGNSLTLRETALILQQGITIGEKPLRDHLEAIGHRDAFAYIEDVCSRSEPLSKRIIKEIHSLVLMNDAANRGIYRSVPVTIVGAAHTPPQPYVIDLQVDILLADYADMLKAEHIIEAVAKFHLRFEGIHPFIDGNGRTGRLIMNFELMKAGLLPVNIKYADRRAYYTCFDEYYATGGSPKLFVEMIANYEEAELQRYIEILRGERVNRL